MALAQAERFGLFSDFDGTLCSFVPYPHTPAMTPRMRELLAAFTERLPVVGIISGRTAIDLRNLVNLPNVQYSGNHGLEFLRGDELVVHDAARPYEAQLAAFARDLGEPAIPGVRYYLKRTTMSISYRAAEQREQTRQQLLERLEQVNMSYGLALSEGHTLWEVKPPIAFNKGTALAAFIDEFHLDAAIFLGDDYTDISALEMMRKLRDSGQIKGLAVAVQGEWNVPAVRQAADVLARDVADVETLLGHLYNNLP
jgi:trehalose-phosphatase